MSCLTETSVAHGTRTNEAIPCTIPSNTSGPPESPEQAPWPAGLETHITLSKILFEPLRSARHSSITIGATVCAKLMSFSMVAASYRGWFTMRIVRWYTPPVSSRTLPTYTFSPAGSMPIVQCAAERTHRELIMEPPQK
uniref:Uncharacterized protein n=1 Tax=Anopheles atroparvus TaxID=41427 RepID=A0A182ISJ8_ANOAO